MGKSVFSKHILEITCADNISLINAINKERIPVENVIFCSDLVIRITVSNSEHRRLLQIADKYGASVEEIERNGVYFIVRAFLRRPVLVFFSVLVLFLFCFLPGKVLFIAVEGNQAVPENLIIEAASECGIRFGAQRRQVRSEMVKNKLLQKIPQLQWAGINTKGCVAVISVREKTVEESNLQSSNQVSSIVAARDGVIQSCTVYQGNPLCTVGQAVKKGQTLVSGYVDCGTVIKATQANAEINALTFRDLQVVSPAEKVARGEVKEKKAYYSLRIGKKQIKFYKDSGNLDTTCGKIYSEKYLQLPGGFLLPVAIVKETHTYFWQSSDVPVQTDANKWIEHFAESYLQKEMIVGEIVSSQTTLETTDTARTFYGKYACIEMIGKIKYEQMIENGDGND
ncbi:MAG: hypothetical protein E7421_04895 [Ruminococcaceae bacterium]|nr:hypothetical protein [Oscillospiraceae bacterium]